MRESPAAISGLESEPKRAASPPSALKPAFSLPASGWVPQPANSNRIETPRPRGGK